MTHEIPTPKFLLATLHDQVQDLLALLSQIALAPTNDLQPKLGEQLAEACRRLEKTVHYIPGLLQQHEINLQAAAERRETREAKRQSCC